MSQHLHITQSKPLILAGRQGRFEVGPSPGIKDLWIKFMEDFGAINGQIGTRAYGVCHNFSGDRKSGKGFMDYLAGVAVIDGGAVPGYLATLIIPKRREAIFNHGSDIASLPQAWERLFTSLLPAAKLEVAAGPQYEVYDFSSPDEPGEIAIHIPVL
jgi:predicted transcriptional regulator YdeE